MSAKPTSDIRSGFSPARDPLDERVVLVDQDDRELGSAQKLAVHLEGRLHRAISVFLFDPAGRLLLQRRAAGKYHSGGLWSNACCSHPRPGESPGEAAGRRLREELGLTSVLEPAFSFIYRADLAHGLVEHELDHVFIGEVVARPTPRPDPREVSGWRLVDLGELRRELAETPERFTVWFRLVLERVVRHRQLRAASV